MRDPAGESADGLHALSVAQLDFERAVLAALAGRGCLASDGRHEASELIVAHAIADTSPHQVSRAGR
jgi:hypothetical protein